MDAVARLEAVEEIRRLKAAYFRTMDTKDWDGFAAVFAPDAVMDMSGEMRDGTTEGEGITRGNRAIAEFVKGAVDPVTTVHHGHMPEIEILSPTTARGIWAMEDKLRWPEGTPIRSMHGYGHYHETYEKVDGRWLIKTITLTRLRVDAEMA
jgi:uncharacterized protein (TIGR02246 family)